jgi:thioredoxin 1
MSGLQEVQVDTFDEEVIRSVVPVLLDFWGPRCVPCIQLDPFVEELSQEFAGRIKIAKVIAPANRKLAIQLKVFGLPTFLAFAQGKEVARVAGEVSRESIREMAEALASRSAV